MSNHTWKLSGSDYWLPDGHRITNRRTRDGAHKAIRLSIASKLNAWQRTGWLSREQTAQERKRCKAILEQHNESGDFEVTIFAEKPDTTIEQVPIGLRPSTRRKVEELAEADGVSVSEWVRGLLEKEVGLR